MRQKTTSRFRDYEIRHPTRKLKGRAYVSHTTTKIVLHYPDGKNLECRRNDFRKIKEALKSCGYILNNTQKMGYPRRHTPEYKAWCVSKGACKK